MRLDDYPETDSPHIDLSERASVESREIDAEGRLVGIDTGRASEKVELKKRTLNKLPVAISA